MAQNEGLRKTGEPIVISDSPDVCLTPMGSAKVPVPYPIVAYFTQSEVVTTTVFFTKDPVFTTASDIPSVIGDEAGVDKGVVSGSHAGGGYCHVVAQSHTLYVKTEGQLVVWHTSKMEMNCSSPQGTGNTIGTVIWQSTSTSVSADPEGNVEGETDPAEEPETKQEIEQKAANESSNPTAESPEEKWKLKNSEASAGYDSTQDKANSYSRQASTDGKPSDGISTSREVKVGADRQLVDKTYGYDSGGKDNYVKIGNVDAKAGAGYTYNADTGMHSVGANAEGGVYGLRAQAKGEIPGGLAGGSIQGEALSAKGNIGVSGYAGQGKVGAKAAAGAEANLAKVTAGGEATVTVKRVYDSTVGALAGWINPDSKYKEAPDYLDFGVVVGAEVEVGIGAGAAAEAEGEIGKDGVKGSARASVGLGPKVAVKATGGIKVPEGLVDKAMEKASNLAAKLKFW